MFKNTVKSANNKNNKGIKKISMASQKNNLLKKNKKNLWRKIKSHSSLFCVWPKTIHKEYLHLPLCLPLYALVFSLLTTEVKASAVNDKAVFNIPRQRADLSLINFVLIYAKESIYSSIYFGKLVFPSLVLHIRCIL